MSFEHTFTYTIQGPLNKTRPTYREEGVGNREAGVDGRSAEGVGNRVAGVDGRSADQHALFCIVAKRVPLD